MFDVQAICQAEVNQWGWDHTKKAFKLTDYELRHILKGSPIPILTERKVLTVIAHRIKNKTGNEVNPAYYYKY